MRSFRLTLTALIALGFALACHAGIVTEPRNMEVQHGQLAVTESGKLLFNASFKGLEPDWDNFENFQGRLVLSFEKMRGTPAFVLRDKAQTMEDVAWKLTTRKINLTGEGDTLLVYVGCCSNTVGTNQEMDTGYSSRVFWYDKEGKELASVPFSFEINAQYFVNTGRRFTIPKEAASFAVRFATDRPDIKNKEFLALNQLRVYRAGTAKQYEKNATFVSPVLSADDAGKKTVLSPGNRIRWSGTIPEGTDTGIQLSVGTPRKGGIAWSSFVGPDGTKKTFYRNGDVVAARHTSAPFLRYWFSVKSAGKQVVLQEVRLGSFTDRNWSTDTPLMPYVRNMTAPGEDLKKPIRLQIESEVPILWNTLHFAIDGRVWTNHLVRKGNEITFTPKTPFCKALHVIRISFRDILGRKVDVKRYFDFVKLPEKNVCTIRDDGMLLIDGKPFFPLAISAMAKKPWNNYSYDIGFRQLKEAGFNTTHTYMHQRTDEFYNEFLPAAEKYGFRLILSGPYSKNSTDLHPIVNIIRNERRLNSVLTWYIGDDTHMHMTVDETAEVADAVRAVDPAHPVSQSDCIRGLHGYAPTTEMFKLQIYPITQDTPEVTERCVAAVIRDMKAVYAIREKENPTLFIWPTLQYFKGWSAWKRYPTPTELRAMTYAALIHGACGLTWYTYGPGNHIKNFGAASTPEHWKIMSEQIQELQKIYPVLCARKAKDQPTIKVVSGPATDVLGYDSISGLLKHVDGKSYLLTVNSSMKPVKAEIRLPGLKGGKVLFENRNVTVKNGVLTDDFAPFAAHVYELK